MFTVIKNEHMVLDYNLGALSAQFSFISLNYILDNEIIIIYVLHIYYFRRHCFVHWDLVLSGLVSAQLEKYCTNKMDIDIKMIVSLLAEGRHKSKPPEDGSKVTAQTLYGI